VVAVPGPGRASRFLLPVVPAAPTPASGEWRAYDVTLAAGADPYGASDRERFWTYVVERGAGAVLVAADPDWEASFLLPVLARAAPGGAKGYLRVGEGRWVRVGREPRGGVREVEVRREAAAARLLAIQGLASGLPRWLSEEAESHERLLFLARGPGPIPGTPVRAVESLAGEWYVDSSLPSGPLAGYLTGAPEADLPPLEGLLALEGAFEFAPLLVRRERRGASRPPLVAGRSGPRRWAVVAAEGTWRWAARSGEPRQVYRGLYAALVGWLLESEGLPVRLDPAVPPANEPVRWRVSAGLGDLSLTVLDSGGRELWSKQIAVPDSLVLGPALPAGTARYRATAAGPDGPVFAERPFVVRTRGRERLPRATAPPLRLSFERGKRTSPVDPRPRPVWPFVLAISALAGEWLWRRRIGLR